MMNSKLKKLADSKEQYNELLETILNEKNLEIIKLEEL
jgi:hypothetical protein